MKKAISIISNWKTVVSGFLVLLSIIVWIADTRYVTKDNLTSHQIKQLYDDIETMEVVKGYSKNTQMYEMLVTLKKNKIKQLGVK